MKRVLLFVLAVICLWACEKTPEEIAVSSVSLSQPTAEMVEGETAQLIATILPSDATDKIVIWASSKQSVATVSNTGLVTAIAEGSSTITASAGGMSATCTVTVSKKNIEVSSVELNKATLELMEGDSETLIATVKPDDATSKTVTWSSSNEEVALVDQNGKVTGVSVGSATITAKVGDKSATCTVTVSKKVIEVSSVELNESTLELVEGDSETLTATVKPDNATDKTVTWTSSNTSVATVSNGTVTAIATGTATITAIAGNKSATCTVTVIVPVSGITLSQKTLTLEVGKTATLTATVKPDNATDKTVTWTSSNTSVATVSNGTVSAVAAGIVTITATAGNKLATCTVTAFQLSSGLVAVDLGLPSGIKWASYNVGATKPEEYGDFFAWGETSPKSDYSWSTYKWCNGSFDTLTKYNNSSGCGTFDNKTHLEMSDDAAHANWGGNWRMPTKEEFNELMSNCTYTWTSYNGVNGQLVTSRKNGNSIFLPAAGYRYGTSAGSAGARGHYWSSSLHSEYFSLSYTSRPYEAWSLHFESSVYTSENDRYLAQSVRPVYGEVPVTSVSLSQETITLVVGKTATLTATVKPDNVSDKTVTWTSSNTSVATVSNGTVTAVAAGTATITAKAGVKSATCTVWVVQASSGPEAVDLGLSVKWASFNVGASAPEENGDYFAWGETSPKSNYDWSTYKWCYGSYNTLTKYNTKSSNGTVDNKTQLQMSDDAARANWGGTWRMPTITECEELRDNCTWSWTTQSGKVGYKVTSTKNGNSIFLPAAGYRSGSSASNVDQYGLYWSSSLWTSNPSDAWAMYFYSGGHFVFDYSRYSGYSVRPVTQ